jgi:hypothetical protein
LSKDLCSRCIPIFHFIAESKVGQKIELDLVGVIELAYSFEYLAIDYGWLGKWVEGFKEGHVLFEMFFHLLDMSLCGCVGR